ncbi:MAG: hypothetical protein KGD61_09465, partial [Candidatus Lokiarchaeota archaeon]|nr:hypothetical protein [Candidatus Lokiarchaeota archaeon]
MERKAVLKWVKIFSIMFFLLSIIELLDLIFFSSLINLNLDTSQYSIIYLIFQSGFMAIHAMLLWFFLLCVICSFIVLSLSIFKVAKKNKIENHILAKFLLLIGLFLIIGSFIKTSFIVLLGNSIVNTGITNETLQYWINTPSNIFGAIMWIYFTVVVGCFLVSGLIFGGIGLKWMLLIQE